MRLLIVEDQSEPLHVLEQLVKTEFSHNPDNHYDVARCYNEAEEIIQKQRYNIILLDHRMPRENMVQREAVDFKRYCETLENIGYCLIPYVKRLHPETVIIGTSSLSERDLTMMPAPDYSVNKISSELRNDFMEILKKIIS